MEEKGETRRYEHRGDNLSRLINLTDGICATALTLLVLTLDIPELKGALSEPTLWQGILDVYPQLLSNFLTFLVVGSYWLAHHWAFEYIIRYDRRLLWFNLMFLLCVGLLPFSTDLLGEHATSRVVWSVYAVHMVITGLTFTGLWGYVASSDMLDSRIHARQVRYMILRSLVVPCVFALSIGIATVSANVAYFSPLLIPVAHRVIRRAYFPPEPERKAAAQRPGRATCIWQVLGFLPLLAFFAWTLYVILF